jgi:pimeloyl-ACP methyl ester carboxylesterase
VERLHVGDVDIAFARVGAGPPLVLAHGAGDDHRAWAPQIAGLARDCTVVAWDEPGQGRSSDPPEGWGLAEYADHLAALIDATAGAPTIVGGISWGGTIAIELHRRHPELVRALILADTYAGWRGSLPPRQLLARGDAAARQLDAADEGEPELPPGLLAADPPAPVARLVRAMAATARTATLRRQLRIMADADLRDALPRIDVPTLLIWGALDARSPLRIAEEFARAIPAARLVVLEGAGHLSNLERPAAFTAAVREFCLALAPSPRREH